MTFCRDPSRSHATAAAARVVGAVYTPVGEGEVREMVGGMLPPACGQQWTRKSSAQSVAFTVLPLVCELSVHHPPKTII